MSIPRLRGRAAQIESPPEDAGKWAYEITVWDLSGEHQVGEPLLFGPYDTEAIACEEGRKNIRRASEAIEEHVTGGVSGKYLDLKNGAIMRPWNEQ